MEVQVRYTPGQNKQVLNFSDSYISPSEIICQQSILVNESHKNTLDNKTSCTDLIGVKSLDVTTSHALLKTTAEDVVTGKEDSPKGMKNDDIYQPPIIQHVFEECSKGKVSGDVRVNDHIEWDDIFDMRLLKDLNLLDTDSNLEAQKDITEKDYSIQANAKYENDLYYSKININPTKTLNMTNNIMTDIKSTLQHPKEAQKTNGLSYKDNTEFNIPENIDTIKRKLKRPNLNQITNFIPKKVKTPIAELIKTSFRKEVSTKTIETWLTDVEYERFGNAFEFQNRTGTRVEEIIPEICKPEKKRYNKKTVQAQLTNKDGVMKFGIPKRNEISEKPRDVNVTAKNVNSVSITVNDKKAKSKFTAPIKSQIPLRDLSYNIINLNDYNFKEHVTKLSVIKDLEIYMVLKLSNGFCQLNDHYTEDASVVEGAMFEISNVIYYWKHIYKTFCRTMERIINNNTIVCYDGKDLLKYFASQCHIDVNFANVKILDVQIGGNLIDPSDPPKNFTDLKKLLSFVPEYAIATECDQQKCAWYLTMLRECFVRLRSRLINYELWKVFVEIEMQVLPIVADMEQRGVRVDIEQLKSMENKLVMRLKTTERACHAAAGRAFQVNSAQQVRNILYEELRLDVRSNVRIRETLCKGDKSTSESMLRTLTAVHPLPRLILEYRHVHKAHATFVAGIASQVKDAVVTPTWEQTVAVTGRIACNNPNLQAIPKAPYSLVLFPAGSSEGEHSTEPNETLNFRSVYIPREGHVLLAADYKHIECRVFAYAATDTGLLDALASPDLFTVLAAKWMNKSEVNVCSEERERTKRVVYASLYGAGTKRIMEMLGVSYDQTLSIMASFNRTFPSLKSFGRTVVAKCEQRDGRLTTLCGRGRTFRNIFSGDFALKSQAERQAVNFIVQGSAADLCKMAMVVTERRLRVAEPPLQAHLLLQIHDELVWEVKQQDLGRAAAEIKFAMEGVGKSCGMAITLPVAISVGRCWGAMEPFPPTHTHR